MKSAKRGYRLGARAEAAEQTRARILDAAYPLFWERDFVEVTLDEIAAKADCTLQTVLRKFGSKDGLAHALLAERGKEIFESRRPAAPDAKSAVAALVASYEEIWEANWRMLRQEEQVPLMSTVLASARAGHRGWIEESFARELPMRGAERERLVDALFTVLDFYVWKLHRRDLGRGRVQTETTMLGLVEAVLATRRAR